MILVLYVDDFTMAGPTKNMAEGWMGINSVIDMDPPEALGRISVASRLSSNKSPSLSQNTLLPVRLRENPQQLRGETQCWPCKTEAKNKVKESRFKPSESIVDKPAPCMVNKVNTAIYGIQDFLGTCVEKRRELAKVDQKTLKHAATPFHEARIAKPVDLTKNQRVSLQALRHASS